MTTTLRLTRPVDALAVVPQLLGFKPRQSLVMMTFGAMAFHARCDLPLEHDDELHETLHETMTGLLNVCLRHGVTRVLLVAYEPGPFPDRVVAAARLFALAGIEVIDIVHDDEGGTYATAANPERRIPHDADSHPMALEQAVERGVPARSREDLAASVEPDPTRVIDVNAIHETFIDGMSAGKLTGGPAIEWMYARGSSEHLTDEDLPIFLAGLHASKPTRDGALIGLDRKNAGDRLHLWYDVVQRTPDSQYAVEPLLCLALCAWLTGHGALAWVAHDRAMRNVTGETPPLADLLKKILEEAMPPSIWIPTTLADVRGRR